MEAELGQHHERTLTVSLDLVSVESLHVSNVLLVLIDCKEPVQVR